MSKKIIAALTAACIMLIPLGALAEGEDLRENAQAVEAAANEPGQTIMEPYETEISKPQAFQTRESLESSDISAEASSDSSAQTEDAVSEAAQPDKQAENISPLAPVSSEINVTVILEERMSVTDSAAIFELYGNNGYLLGTREEWVGGVTTELNMRFDVPEYHTGEKFKLRLAGGLTSLTYYADKIYPGGEFELETYCYNDGNGNTVIGNSFVLSGEPEFEKAVVLYVNGKQQSFSPPAKIMDSTAMAPAELLCSALKIKYRYDWEYNSAVCSAGDDMVFFNRDTSYTTAFGSDFYAPRVSEYIDDTFYIPIRTLADCFECGIDVYDQYDHIDVCLGESQKVKDYYNSFLVNRNGISSRTKNLIWVSKSEYTVRVFEGSQYNWEPIKSFPCGIGAYGTPTVTGQFEYIERVSSWNYANYYVGPVLRFYNGYAIHSTLLNYNGSEYDGTVRAHISHGCVRCHPWDINWLDKTVSLGTRIYITE